ncbi:MAG: DM13 domain-containing protein [Bacteroidota bacterium]
MRFLLVAAAGLVVVAGCQNTPDEVADDPLPTEATAPEDETASAEETVPTVTASQIQAEANMPTEPTAEDMPAAPEEIARGSFSGASGHDVSGEAVWYRLDDGSNLIRLEGLDSDNGPDLEVWLVRRTTGDVGQGGASLGSLKSTRGNQNYPVPDNLDPADFAGVSVWCERFSVNFGVAPLADS